MAWEHFPVERGQRLTAAMLNELSDAAKERKLPHPKFKAGHRASLNVTDFIDWLQYRIKTSVQDGRWWWVESWTDPVTWSIWKLSLDETDASASPPLKNVFEAAFGAGHTDWRKRRRVEEIGLLEAQELNDIYLVLKILKYIPAVNITGITQPSYRRRSVSGYATCSAAMTALDSATFSRGPSFIPTQSVIDVHATSVGRNVVSPYDYYAGQAYRAAFRGVKIPANASKLYLRWEAWASRSGYLGVPYGLARDQYGYLLYGQSPLPSDFYDTWGTYYETITFASGTKDPIQRVEKFDAPSEGDFYFAMYGDPSMSASGASLCELGNNVYEDVIMIDPPGNPPYPSLIEMNYTKS